MIPCKNEAASLHLMLQDVPSYVDEVIVVDNGSTDTTRYVGEQHGAKVISEKKHNNGVGYGYAHQKGLKEATGDYIVAMDGDNTYPLAAIKDVISYMEKGNVDIVSCSRFPLSQISAISFVRRLGIRILNATVIFLYGYEIKDILSGMWVVRRESIKELSLESGDWNFSPEIKLAALVHPTIHFSEYHIAHMLRLNGTSKQQIFKTGVLHLAYIIKRRFTLDRDAGQLQRAFLLYRMQYMIRVFNALPLINK